MIAGSGAGGIARVAVALPQESGIIGGEVGLIEQLRDLRDEVLRQRAQMRQSYMAALNQANLSANYAGLLRDRDRDARDAAGAAARNQ